MGTVDETSLYHLLEELRRGQVEPEEVVRRLRRLPYGDLGFARVDHHRVLRQGLPEAVYGPGKSIAHCVAIVGELLSEPDGGPVVLTRADQEQAEAAMTAHPGGHRYGPTVVWRPAAGRPDSVVVLAAGTADLVVAEECTSTLRAIGFDPVLVADCGVAGVHRLFEHLDLLQDADAVVVIAGMEGALASVVGGLTGAPVVAVPTSTGYGASLEGVTALLAMMATCAPGLSVVGIDNGFGAAYAVGRALRPRRTSTGVTGTGVTGTGVTGTGVTGTGVTGRQSAGSPAPAPALGH